jgi:hypothetical protein
MTVKFTAVHMAAIGPESGVTGSVGSTAKTALVTHMYGPAVRRKRISSSWW